MARRAGDAAARVCPRRREKEVGREPQRHALPERPRVLHVVDVALMMMIRERDGWIEKWRERKGRKKR